MIIKKEGKVIAKIIVNETPKDAVDKAGKKLIEVEQELNHRVANEIYKKFGVGVRFHI